MTNNEINWYDNSIPQEVRSKLDKLTRTLAPALILFLFIFLVIINPAGGSRILGIALTIIATILMFFGNWSGYYYHPVEIGVDREKIYFKKKNNKVTTKDWWEITRLSDDSKYMYFSSLILYGGEDIIYLFSDAKRNIRTHWEEYLERRDKDNNLKLELMERRLNMRKRQVLVLSIFLMLSIILTLFFYNHKLLITVSILIMSSFLLGILSIYFIHGYHTLSRKVKDLVSEIQTQQMHKGD